MYTVLSTALMWKPKVLPEYIFFPVWYHKNQIKSVRFESWALLTNPELDSIAPLPGCYYCLHQHIMAPFISQGSAAFVCLVSAGVARHYCQNALPSDEGGPCHPAGLQALQGEILHPRGQQTLQKCPSHEGLWQAREVAHTPQGPAQVWRGS